MPLSKIVDVADTIGNTPVVRLTNVEGIGATFPVELIGKLEYMNPGASIKDRVAKHICQQLDQRQIPKDALLIVAGPGNLAISLAMLQRRLLDRIHLLKASGITDIVRTLDGALPGSSEHPVEIGKRIMQQRPGSVYVDEELGDWDLSQCYQELADEIIEQTDGQLDALVLGVDTGNAATHLSRALKQKLPQLQVVGVEPKNSAIGEDSRANPLAKRWLCEDIGRVYAPRALAANAIDFWVQISDTVAYSMARRLIRGGITGGPSSGASVAAARMYAVANLQMGQRALAAQQDKYRAASIEDLQLPAAVTVSESEPIANACRADARARLLAGARDRPWTQADRTLLGNGVAKPSEPTPLHDLSKFFEVHSVAFVTDYSRKFCLGIATKQDLLNFLARRNTSHF
ncbi:tryptophan synthase beta subunit-like PLP-dependent enzyme [Linderina pennispora]|uniref:Tryptophan synthase beta subunit-like PLP-dependent enzyme n=1 Tax=Linderina pennispora TaxID=61395 RepID=A0A1Y1WEJ9_9FUNG|nr:tryptophan synthase beta subunit-like PLP-dependent enzyme [Linderina pennispora]ORX71951.1 tryptophan synthase beta subunit-like PLP-dependent enzyme [Linderina pennispora]